MIKPGDFVTTCSAGYWELLELKPKIATEDYRGEQVSWKKGDCLGQWAIVRKVFTPKLKPKIDFEYVDASWLRPVTGDERAAIHQYFQEHPDYRTKCDAAGVKLAPAITNCWLRLPPEQEEAFRTALASLPQRYTMEEFWRLQQSYRQYVSQPPASHLINFFSYPWDMDHQFNTVFSGCALHRL